MRRLGMPRITLKERLDPVLVGAQLGSDQVLLEEQARRAEFRPGCRRTCERRGCEVGEPTRRSISGSIGLELRHDVADRLVDEREPDLFGARHGRRIGQDSRLRAVSLTSREVSPPRSEEQSGPQRPPRVPRTACGRVASESNWASSDATLSKRRPQRDRWTSAGAKADVAERAWRQVPAARRDNREQRRRRRVMVVSPRPRSVGTKRIPPPTPNMPARTPASQAETTPSDQQTSLDQIEQPDAEADSRSAREGRASSIRV